MEIFCLLRVDFQLESRYSSSVFVNSITSFRRFFESLLKDSPACLKVVVGTKLDRVESDAQGNIAAERQVQREAGRQYARQINGEFYERHPNIMTVPFFETSSKENCGVSEMFAHTFDLCCLELPASSSCICKSQSVKINIHHIQEQPDTEKTKKKCSC